MPVSLDHADDDVNRSSTDLGLRSSSCGQCYCETNPATREWFACYTTPRHEKVVSRYFGHRGIEHFLPLYSHRSQWKDGSRKALELPLFPSYIFVRLARSECVRALQIPGVLSVVGNGRNPSAISATEIDSLRTAVMLHKVEPHPYLVVGEKVRIRAGALEGLEGILLRHKNSVRVVCALDLIAQCMSVEVDAADVEPVSTSPRCRATSFPHLSH